MEMRPDFQQTEAGFIPKGWRACRFIEAVGSYIDYRGRTPNKLGLSWGNGDIPALSALNVLMGKIDLDKDSHLGSEELYQKWMVQGKCEKGDVLLTMEAPLGNVAQIPDSRKYILSQRVLLIKPRSWLLCDYLAHFMKSGFFQGQLLKNSTGSTAKGIKRARLDELYLYFPPDRVEQEAISAALSDADKFIDSIEQFIAKMHDLKHAIMQQLLTGETRLSRFTENWTTHRIGEILKILHGKSQRGVEDRNGAFPILATGGQIGTANHFLYDKPSVLIGRKGTIDQPQYMDTPFWTVDTLFYSQVFEPNCAKFIFYVFCLIQWKQYNEASGVPSLNASTIERI